MTDCLPGVPLRSTPGFMPPSATRTGFAIFLRIVDAPDRHFFTELVLTDPRPIPVPRPINNRSNHRLPQADVSPVPKQSAHASAIMNITGQGVPSLPSLSSA